MESGYTANDFTKFIVVANTQNVATLLIIDVILCLLKEILQYTIRKNSQPDQIIDQTIVVFIPPENPNIHATSNIHYVD